MPVRLIHPLRKSPTLRTMLYTLAESSKRLIAPTHTGLIIAEQAPRKRRRFDESQEPVTSVAGSCSNHAEQQRSEPNTARG